MSAASPVPSRLDLKRDEKLEIVWQDGKQSTYSLSYLRSMCPCAICKMVREGQDPHDIVRETEPRKKTSLTILPGNYSEPIRVLHAELVGNYAIRIDWSDQHGSGIYSFEYLRELMGELPRSDEGHVSPG